MSQGGPDKRHANETKPAASDETKISESPPRNAADATVTASSTSSTTPTESAHVNGDKAVEASAAQEKEQSPGPHPEEAANGVDEEGESTRANGSSQEQVSSDDNAPSSSQSSSDGEQNLSIDNLERDLRRVKIYELVGSRWTERGTAFCFGDFDQHAEEAKLIARSEFTSEALLSCTVRASDVYQRQDDTLIMWTEPDGTEYALSFQDTEGCSEVWDFITEVQHHLHNNRAAPLAPPGGTAAQIIESGQLPAPKPNALFIGEIEKAIRTMTRTAKSRETMCSYMQENQYIYQLLETFELAEKGENLDALHALCRCMWTILLLNEHQMYEHILNDDLWMGVVGMLEYDPSFPKYKANYREFLLEQSRFVQPIGIDDVLIQRKIHHTYRLQYLKDVILSRLLDDSTFNVLNSCIIFNQIDIINHVQQDERFLRDLVLLFTGQPGPTPKSQEKEKLDSDSSMESDAKSSKTAVNGADSSAATDSPSPQQAIEEDADRKKDVILLLQQLCAMGKNIQLPARISLFRTLAERGVLFAVQWALCQPEKVLVSTAGEILAVLLDHHTHSVRSHSLMQAMSLGQPTGYSEAVDAERTQEFFERGINYGRRFKETLPQVLSRMLANSQDLALQNQLSDALRMLTNVPSPETPEPPTGPKQIARPPRDDQTTERFLENFYKVCVDTLFRPLTHDIPDYHDLKNKPFTPSRERGNLYLYLCDLLCSFLVQHSSRCYSFVLLSNVVPRIASLLSVRDKHLCLAGLRFFRICLRINNRPLFTHLHKHECFTPIVTLTVREARRDNLLSSTCQELFEYMRKENLRDPINYVMEKHESEMRELAKSALGASTFQGLVSRWEINNEPPPSESEKKQTLIPGRLFGSRMMESDEEDSYFHGDDDDDPVIPVPRADTFFEFPQRKRQRTAIRGAFPPHRGLARPLHVPSQQRPASPLSSLLEYDEDDDFLTSPHTEKSMPLLPGRPSPSTSASPTSPASTSNALSADSPTFTHRQIQILPYEPSEHDDDVEPSDPEDDMLEALVANGPPPISSTIKPSAIRIETDSGSGKPALGETSSTSPSSPSPSVSTSFSLSNMISMIKPRVKRGRDDDDDDDMLSKLAPKSRRMSIDSRRVGVSVNTSAGSDSADAKSSPSSTQSPTLSISPSSLGVFTKQGSGTSTSSSAPGNTSSSSSNSTGSDGSGEGGSSASSSSDSGSGSGLRSRTGPRRLKLNFSAAKSILSTVSNASTTSAPAPGNSTSPTPPPTSAAASTPTSKAASPSPSPSTPSPTSASKSSKPPASSGSKPRLDSKDNG